MFPWQHNGVQLKRTWPIGENEAVLAARWRELVALTGSAQAIRFRETGDRKVSGRYGHLSGEGNLDPSISSLTTDSELPLMAPYAYRSLDRHWVIADSRVGDRIRPELWRSHGQKQVYMIGFLTEVPGNGPAAVASSDVPDLHHFRGSFGGKHVIPLWRDRDASDPNVTAGILHAIGAIHKKEISPEILFAYVYGVLAHPAYVERFWDELEQPPPRVPVTKDAELFQRMADHGARLLHLHTYGTRFANAGDDGKVPQGAALCTVGGSSNGLPIDFKYDPTTETLTVGERQFAPVTREVWEYSVSGYQVVKSWAGSSKVEAVREKVVGVGRHSAGTMGVHRRLAESAVGN